MGPGCLKPVVAAALVVAILPLNGPLRAQDPRPLPNQDAFLAEVRKHLHRDRVLRSQYIYTEKQTRFERDSRGTIVKQTVKVFEVHPSIEEDLTYERLLSVDGVPVDRRELEKADREQLQKQRERAATLQREGANERDKRVEKLAEERRKEQAAIDEIFALYSIRIAGRELLEGHSTIAFRLEPKADYRPRTNEGKIMKKFRVQAWVSEDDYELAKLDVEAVDNVLVGLGFIARLDKGSRGLFQRRKVRGEIWLPAQSRLVGTGRLLLLKRIRLDQVSDYSDYKRFSVETSTTF